MKEIVVKMHDTGKLEPVSELVRCQCCKHRYDSMRCPIALIADLLKDTKVFEYKVSDDWFCADGESEGV